MHLEILLEEPSAEEALKIIVPRMVPPEVSFRIHAHLSKADLLGSLEGRLRGYSRWMPRDWMIVVLVDEDRGDCRELKARLERASQRAGLVSKSRRRGGQLFQMLNRIAIEELEAWFFGDIDALRAAYPRVPGTLAARAAYRNPDAIGGGTWEALERVLRNAGYHRGGLPKIAAAKAISNHMMPERNRSHSFQVFRTGLLEAVQQAI